MMCNFFKVLSVLYYSYDGSFEIFHTNRDKCLLVIKHFDTLICLLGVASSICFSNCCFKACADTFGMSSPPMTFTKEEKQDDPHHQKFTVFWNAFTLSETKITVLKPINYLHHV